jgi:hypothetical protein
MNIKINRIKNSNRAVTLGQLPDSDRERRISGQNPVSCILGYLMETERGPNGTPLRWF